MEKNKSADTPAEQVPPVSGSAEKDGAEKGSRKSSKKTGKKNDAQLLIRINGEERDAFLALCEELDTSAAREVRRFIRSFIREHQSSDV